MSFSETIFLFVLALVIFGPKKLPEIARQAGKLLNEFRRASNEFKSQIEQEIAHIEVEKNRPTPIPPPLGATSRTPASTPATLAAAPAAEVATPATSVATEADEPLFASTQPADQPALSTAAASAEQAAPSPESSHPVESSPQESHA